jgi:hypothetical protein
MKKLVIVLSLLAGVVTSSPAMAAIVWSNTSTISEVDFRDSVGDGSGTTIVTITFSTAPAATGCSAGDQTWVVSQASLSADLVTKIGNAALAAKLAGRVVSVRWNNSSPCDPNGWPKVIALGIQ